MFTDRSSGQEDSFSPLQFFGKISTMEIKKARVILEVDIEGRGAKLEFDLTDEEAQKVLEILNQE
jgi:hypothetical protein